MAHVIYYASPVWSPTATTLVLKALEPAQRGSVSAIIESFKSVSLSIAEAD